MRNVIGFACPPTPFVWQASHSTWRDPACGGALRGGWEIRTKDPHGRDVFLKGGFSDKAAAERWIRDKWHPAVLS